MNDTTVELLETIDRIERISGIVPLLTQGSKDRSRVDEYMVTLLNASKALIEAYLIDRDDHKVHLANELAQMAVAHVDEGEFDVT